MRRTIRTKNVCFHTQLHIAYTHKATFSKFFYQFPYNCLNLIDVICCFFIFAKHSLCCTICFINALVHYLHNITNLLHIVYHVLIRAFHISHGRINNINVITHLRCIFCNRIYTIAYLTNLISRFLNQA